MRLPQRLTTYLAARYVPITAGKPDFIIGRSDDKYLSRWHLFKSKLFGCNLHLIERSLNDVPHDHPWPSISIVLEGGYIEHTHLQHLLWKARKYQAGDVIFRRAKTAHRLVIDPHHAGGYAVTLFLRGPRIRESGFHCPKGWKHWKEFVAPLDGNISRVGRGCA